jgi:chloride channel protein, CIC family
VPDPSTPVDVPALLKSRQYLVLLVVVGVLGAPIAAAAYWFLYLVSELQKWLYNPAYLLQWLGFHGEPVWWPLPLLGLAGILVGLTIHYLPGRGGHSPADGFHAGGISPAIDLPGIALAALTGLALGAVIGPEAPLIALGGGLAAAAVRAVKRDLPAQSIQVVGAAGSFAAISTLLGSPLAGAFLLMEGSGIGGPAMGLVLVPGLLAAGIGTLIFVGFDSWTGHGTYALTIPSLPPFTRPDVAELGWAIVIGLAAIVLGGVIRWIALYLKPHVERRIVMLAPVVGLAAAGLAIAFQEISGHPSSQVLFSGQDQLPVLVSDRASYSLGALVLLVGCKSLAYGGSLAAFRGGPIFPAIFIGGAGGLAMSHLPGLPELAGLAMGIGAMSCVMLGLPMTSALLATLLLGSSGVSVLPLVIVAVVVAYVGRSHFAPTPRQSQEVPGASEPETVGAERTGREKAVASQGGT